MPSYKKKATAAKLSPWRASLLRCRAHSLGVACAADETAALAAVITDLRISEKQRRCLGTRSSGASSCFGRTRSSSLSGESQRNLHGYTSFTSSETPALMIDI